MKRALIYDLPTRVFHWLFVLFFVVAFVVSKRIDDDQPRFSHHMIAGMVLLGLVGFRIVWGLVGSQYARFRSFELKPADLLRYFKGVVSGQEGTWPGHNPASSWTAVIMMFLAIALGLTGFLMTRDRAFKDLKDIHELLANVFFAVAVVHVAGVALHSLRHRDAIWKSIITGYKLNVPAPAPSIRTFPAVAVAVLVVAFGFAGYAATNFNSDTRELAVMGVSLHLEKAGHGDKKHNSGEVPSGGGDHDD